MTQENNTMPDEIWVSEKGSNNQRDCSTENEIMNFSEHTPYLRKDLVVRKEDLKDALTNINKVVNYLEEFDGEIDWAGEVVKNGMKNLQSKFQSVLNGDNNE